MGEFYSYAGEANPDAVMGGSSGYLSTYVEERNPAEILINTFFENEGTKSDRVDSVNINRNIDYYSDGIYIPITNEEGLKMHEKALEIRSNPELYSLWNHNCGQVSQLILEAAGKNFAATEFDWWNTRPNSVYDNIVGEINALKKKGWLYGHLQQFGFSNGNITLIPIAAPSNATINYCNIVLKILCWKRNEIVKKKNKFSFMRNIFMYVNCLEGHKE